MKRPIEEFPDYCISKAGRIYNKKGKLKVTFRNKKGYIKIQLYRQGKKFNRFVHLLVFVTFLI